MSDKDIALFIMVNEPAFYIGDKQYSVCCPNSKRFYTWDSDNNELNFKDISDLLDNWIINGKPFREIVQDIM